MSEEYDAVIIIVSEETGRISAAHEGQLERNLSEEALRNYIITELGLLTEEGKEDTSKKDFNNCVRRTILWQKLK